ncbi:hypothetical protein E2562_027680 [Oryza meyeriana var. granulata]|uniref:Uncharacterized protein n=1 Tax=Oryza meyeriana var. granulata TaxID=110450 RepID=A0A6G1EQH3_9ORYZ|nr:hypothetical protein E2562_027680 [Oryza meyeriana var. granulata]
MSCCLPPLTVAWGPPQRLVTVAQPPPGSRLTRRLSPNPAAFPLPHRTAAYSSPHLSSSTAPSSGQAPMARLGGTGSGHPGGTEWQRRRAGDVEVVVETVPLLERMTEAALGRG